MMGMKGSLFERNSLYCVGCALFSVHEQYNRGYFVLETQLEYSHHCPWQTGVLIAVPASTNQHWEKNGNTSWKVDHTVGCPVQRELREWYVYKPNSSKIYRCLKILVLENHLYFLGVWRPNWHPEACDNSYSFTPPRQPSWLCSFWSVKRAHPITSWALSTGSGSSWNHSIRSQNLASRQHLVDLGKIVYQIWFKLSIFDCQEAVDCLFRSRYKNLLPIAIESLLILIFSLLTLLWGDGTLDGSHIPSTLTYTLKIQKF